MMAVMRVMVARISPTSRGVSARRVWRGGWGLV